MATRPLLSICLIVPKFEPSFFGNEYALDILPGRKRSTMMGCGLPLLAALTPQPHRVTIVDESVGNLDLAHIARTYDVVGLTGMIVQRNRMVEILGVLREGTAMICVGGPLATVDPSAFIDACDALFIGEADETWPRFVEDFAAGRPTERSYKQATATDISQLPTPRFDLVTTQRYASAAVQFSRGCPFLCEFCDIIVMFGHKPRLKSNAQIIAEIELLRSLGVTHVFFVDDNFIGNKAKAASLLKALVEWQEANGYPLYFSTEMSINLGDEPELLELLYAANFRSIFIGIESPRAASLLETRKVQNVRGDSLAQKLDRIRDAGLIVQAGFIVGFDNDDASVFEEQFRFIQENGIGIAIVSMLSPIPTTPLFDRLQRERRLLPKEEILWFEPKSMSRRTLLNGYSDLNRRLYEPDAFFERILKGYGRSASFRSRLRIADARRTSSAPRENILLSKSFRTVAFRLVRAMWTEGRFPTLLAYLRAYLRQRRTLRAEAWSPQDFLVLCVRHWHLFRIANQERSYWGRAGTDASERQSVSSRGVAPAVEAAST